MVTAILREASCERGGRAADLPTVRLHFYRDCTLVNRYRVQYSTCDLKRHKLPNPRHQGTLLKAVHPSMS